MASVKVAVRVRPFNQREKDMNAKLIVQMEGKKTSLLTVKNSKEQNDATREKYKDFTFDHSYWSYDSHDENYASQEQVFSDLGVDVIESAFEGYNACVFAYGQTGSGKTFTMMGSPECQGLIPRICRQLFSRVAAGKESGASYRTEVSYLEIYNERVKDLLANDVGHSLRVREHPKLGPYVQDLSQHLVSDYDDIQECMHRGNLHRTTASTQMNDVSSRSHAIFTITFVRASYLRHNNMPSETVSKVHLVDLAGSERADATGATGQRLVEGAHINKSLVTLGSVISALAESAQLNDVSKGTPKGNRKQVFIPYRDSVLTWLLKDSLGGNSKTIMIAAISPADCNYGETLSTLRYANRAKNIINKPTINEDPNVKLIRELREEIEKLRAQISHSTDDPIETEAGVLATLQRKEAQEKVLTEKWTEKWRETQQILQEQKALGLRKSGLGVVLDSDMPHLVGIDDNLLSTGVTLYHLKEGETLIGTTAHSPLPDIVLSGSDVLPSHCRLELRGGVATLHPEHNALCWINTVLCDKPTRLSQGCILLLGRTNMFRYNDPAEAAKLRQEGSNCLMNLSRLSLLSFSTTDLSATADEIENDLRSEQIELQRAELERERQQFLLQQEERQRELLMAQKRLNEEREAMQRQYSIQMSRGWSRRRRSKQEQSARARRLRATRDVAEKEESQLASLREVVERKREELETFARGQVEMLVAQGYRILDDESTSPDSPLSSTECLMRLALHCDPVVQGALDKHRKELTELEEELQKRVSSVAAHRMVVERLQGELSSMSQDCLCDDEPSPEALKRSKSELILRESSQDDDVIEPLSADEREVIRNKKMSLTLPLPSSPLSPPPASFHSAECEAQLAASGGAAECARPGDSDDMSSTEDYHKPTADGQSSSSVERSPEDRQRTRHRKRLGDNKSRRQVTEAEALLAMQRLCQRIASQKMLVISSLENDCSKEELNRQIAVLQELQKKYVRLEMALQYSLFSSQSSRGPVTPIQEASITASESEHPVSNERDLNHNGCEFQDPLLNRLKESELEGADEVSTSNEELQSETWSEASDDTSALARARALAILHDNSPTIPLGLNDPIDFDRVISIPGWVTRGAGAATHHEYEVRVSLQDARWALLRRYRRFRDLYLSMCTLYGHKVQAIPFPPRQIFTLERVARSRRAALEQFLRRLLTTVAADPRCPFHSQPLTRETLCAFSPFFRKGVFESGKCGTG